MRVRLKEDPKEWRNFTLLCCAFLLVLSGIGFWKKVFRPDQLGIVAGLAVLLALAAWICPRAFRGWYRVAMKISAWIGEVMGKVILGVFYLIVLTPLGLVLRLGGKDLLETGIDRKRESYWKPARKRGELEQQF